MHEEALAYELAGYFYLELKDTASAIQHFLLARERYNEWVSTSFYASFMILVTYLLLIAFSIFAKGAFGKSDSLFNFVEGINSG